jgi:hypothetical protein
MSMRADFFLDLIDRTLANPFSDRSLTNGNLFEDGQNLPEMILGLIKYHLKSGELQGFLGASGGSFKGINGLFGNSTS